MLFPLLSLGLKGCVAYSSAKLLRRALQARRKHKPPAILDLRKQRGALVIVTTAAIPWRTGTAVNPALRAAYLAALTQYEVTLVVPFIPVQDQQLIFPAGVTCSTPQQQAAVIRSWVQEHSQLPAGAANFNIVFYKARYYPASRCIFASEDIVKLIPSHNVSLVLLEEPEHLNWYRSNTRWTSHFKHVVGVLHTHYSGYAGDLPGGFINSAAVGLVCRVVCKLHCHKTIQLSEIARGLSRSTVVNVHGVSAKFLRVGQQQAHRLWKQQQQQHLQQEQLEQTGATLNGTCSCFSQGCYFLGKALWDKGHGEMMDLLQQHQKKYGQVSVDVFGVGPDLAAIQADAERRKLPLVFKGHADHCSEELQHYKVFINCCKKDVLATATAEAVAMNKWVILPSVACNQFFKSFPNVLMFNNKATFSHQLLRALDNDPPPLSGAQLRELSWAAATERLLAAASIHSHEWPGGLAQAWDDCLWVPYRMFALLFKGARRLFAEAPQLQPESGLEFAVEQLQLQDTQPQERMQPKQQ